MFERTTATIRVPRRRVAGLGAVLAMAVLAGAPAGPAAAKLPPASCAATARHADVPPAVRKLFRVFRERPAVTHWPADAGRAVCRVPAQLGLRLDLRQARRVTGSGWAKGSGFVVPERHGVALLVPDVEGYGLDYVTTCQARILHGTVVFGFQGVSFLNSPAQFYGLATDDVRTVVLSGGLATGPHPTTVRATPKDNVYRVHANNGARYLTSELTDGTRDTRDLVAPGKPWSELGC